MRVCSHARERSWYSVERPYAGGRLLARPAWAPKALRAHSKCLREGSDSGALAERVGRAYVRVSCSKIFTGSPASAKSGIATKSRSLGQLRRMPAADISHCPKPPHHPFEHLSSLPALG